MLASHVPLERVNLLAASTLRGIGRKKANANKNTTADGFVLKALGVDREVFECTMRGCVAH